MEISGMVQREVKKKTSIYGATAVLLAILLVSIVYVVGTAPIIFPSESPAVAGMKTFTSNQELVDYLSTGNNGYASDFYGGPLDSKFFGSRTQTTTPSVMGTFGTGTANNLPPPQEYWAQSGAYSTTNIQVQGVDEADTVKTDGRYIYTISNEQPIYWLTDTRGGSSASDNAVYIVDANPNNAIVVSKIALDGNIEPAGLYLSSDSNRLVVIASKYQYHLYSDRDGPELMIMPSYQADVYTFLYVYDVSNKAQPSLARNLTLSGSYFNSRMIGDNVYAVVSQTAWVYDGRVSLPIAYDGDIAYQVPASAVYYADMNDTAYSFTSFYGINIQNDAHPATNMTVLMGGASTMYVSPNNIYVTYAGWDPHSGQYTAIYRIAINGLQISLAAQGSVPGSPLNQYAMDEYNGYFRVATNWYSDTQISNVYVLNADLTVAGKLEGLAPNENLHATRFMGDRCYLVTFKTTDPLFVIDLSDPTDPRLLGELKSPGYSDYLHPYDDTHLIGIGKDAVEEGDVAYFLGVKLSLFDVGDIANPVEVASVTIGDRGSDSEALRDPKAFLFDRAKNLLVVPISYAVVSDYLYKEHSGFAYSTTVWQGAYVYSVTDTGFTLKGTVTHLDPALLGRDGYLKDPSIYYTTQNQWINRALYIGDVLYTISNAQISLNSLSDLSPIATVNLA